MEPDGLEPTTPALQTRFFLVYLLLLPDGKIRKNLQNTVIYRVKRFSHLISNSTFVNR